MASILDLKSKEEKDAELDRKIAALRKKNEALVRRHELIEEDRKRAEHEGVSVTTPRKSRQPDCETEKTRKQKENFSITLDVSAGEKRVVNDGKPSKLLHGEKPARSPSHKTGGWRGGFSGGREPQVDREPFKTDVGKDHLADTNAGRRRSQGSDAPKRSPRISKNNPGEPWTRRSERGERGPGRGGGTPLRSGGPIASGDGAPVMDRKVKEWEERRKLNIEMMNEEMEKIAEYERSQRDGVREKNPVRNFLDDPRRTGPIIEVDRKEGSRRHIRNWGGPDFEKVKTGMDREKESHIRRPGVKKQMDMTMSMTGRERAEYVRWKQERDQIDQERLARHRKPTGQWRREWDAEKTDTMFKEGAAPPIEDDGAFSRRDQERRGAPKPPTMSEFLPTGLKKPKETADWRKNRGRNKPYNMHDSRWRDDEDEFEKDNKFSEEKVKEKHTCVTEKEEPKVENRSEKIPEMSPTIVESDKGDEDLEDECDYDSEDGEDDGEWTDASGESEEIRTKVSPAAPLGQRLPREKETPEPTMPSPPANPIEHDAESKPAVEFSPVGHRPVVDWGEEMEMASPSAVSSENSPIQAAIAKVSDVDKQSLGNSPPESSQSPAMNPAQDLTSAMESVSVPSNEIEEEKLHDRLPEEITSEEVTSEDIPATPAEEKCDRVENHGEGVAVEITPVEDQAPPTSAETTPVAEELEGAAKAVHIADYETSAEVPPSS